MYDEQIIDWCIDYVGFPTNLHKFFFINIIF